MAPVLKAALLWVVLFFAAFSGLAHVFTHEEETNTATALRLSAPPGAVYAGKLAFNLTVLGVVALVITPIYMLMTGSRPGTPISPDDLAPTPRAALLDLGYGICFVLAPFFLRYAIRHWWQSRYVGNRP